MVFMFIKLHVLFILDYFSIFPFFMNNYALF